MKLTKAARNLGPSDRLCKRCSGSGFWIDKDRLCFRCYGTGIEALKTAQGKQE
jgi:DnaJ-class molecular chaperone